MTELAAGFVRTGFEIVATDAVFVRVLAGVDFAGVPFGEAGALPGATYFTRFTGVAVAVPRGVEATVFLLADDLAGVAGGCTFFSS